MFNIFNANPENDFTGLIITIVIVAIILIIFIKSVKVVKQTDKYVIQRLGGYHATWGVGIHFLLPFFDKIERVVNLKEQVKDFDPQPVITKDNVTMQIDTVVFFQVTDPKLFCYGVDNPISALENLSATTLRNIIGDLDLDQTLTSRDIINTKMRSILDEATDPWGIKVNRVEVKNILPPKDIREAMEKQMRAEREKREAILKAEGQKQSAILKAQGEKEAAILTAEGQKEQMIRIAEGEAEAVRVRKEAEALGVKLLNEAHATSETIQLRALDALTQVADGQATKIIIPSELQNLTGILAALKTVNEEK
jgi:regulator of protease activity HflC (stomatin/prohibitin superfamily)